MDFEKIFTNYDISAMDSYYNVFMYFYKKLPVFFHNEKAGSIAADLTIAFLNNYDLDSEV